MIRLIRAELLKFATTRLWWGMLIGVVAISALSAAATAALAGSTVQGTSTPGLEDPAVLRGIYTGGLSITYMLTLAIGIIAMAGEYRHETMTATVLAAPRRQHVVVAKLAALTVIGGGYGVAMVATGVLVGLPVILGRGGSPHLTQDGIPRALALAVLAVALWAILGLGIGTLIRNQVVALLVTIGIVSIAEPIITYLLQLAEWGSVARFLPGTATGALVTPVTDSGGVSFSYLPWWGGALMLFGYAVVSGGIGAALTLRRDIS